MDFITYGGKNSWSNSYNKRLFNAHPPTIVLNRIESTQITSDTMKITQP